MKYNIFLDNEKIGTSLLEKADPPMGVVSGQIIFTEKPLTFDFFSKYCLDNGIKTEEDAEHKFISTQTIPTLKVINENGIAINGVGCYIEGFGSDPMEIFIIGIPYPFYQEEFPHHRKAYDDQFR
jgi:hypothetical protein